MNKNHGSSRALQIAKLVDANKEAKKQLRKAQRQENARKRTQHHNTIMQASENDDELFYRLIRIQRGHHFNDDEMMVDDRIICDPDEIREEWANYFEDLSHPAPNVNFDNLYKDLVDEDHIVLQNLMHTLSKQEDCSVTPAEVCAAIKKLNNKKAPDKAGIQSEHLKFAGQEINQHLADVFSAILDESVIPHAFKEGVTIPILKKGKSSLHHDNYRGITITSTIGKILEHILLKRLKTKTTTIQSRLQRGFTEGTSSLTAALILSEQMNEALDNKSELYIASLDARKAFDMVYHPLLMRKLYLSDVDPLTWCSINNWYEDLSSQVMWKGELSHKYNIDLGVRQGGVFSAENYKSYINPLLLDLEDKGVGSRIGPMYTGSPTCADDILLTANNEYELQHMLNITTEYANRNRYVLHPEKSVVMIFNPVCEDKNLYTKWHINKKPLPVVTNLTHLGINRNNKNNSADVQARVAVARRTAYALMGAGLHGVNGVSPTTSWKLLNTYVIPRYTHGLEITDLGKKDFQTLNRLHKKTLKQIQSLPERTADAAVYLLLGAPPLEAILDSKKLILFGSICRDGGVEKDIACRQISIKDYKTKSWFVDIKQCLLKYSLPDAMYLLQNPVAKNAWKNDVKLAVETYWNEQLRIEAASKSSLKYMNYSGCCIGNHHLVWGTTEPSIWDNQKAAIKARILTGTYTLQSNRAKFNQFNVDGTCKLCNQEVEDREHFLAVCTALSTQRAPYIRQLEEIIVSDHGEDTWSHLMGNCSDLTQLIIDSSKPITGLPSFNATVIEPVTRNLCSKLHHARMKILTHDLNL